MPTDVAERLIVEGFLGEVTAALPVDDVADHVTAMVQAKLGAGGAS